jgi:aspartate kinase
MIVMKFGGSSVGGTEEIKKVCNIIKSKLEKKPIVIVSAIKGVTDMLISLGNDLALATYENRLQEIKNKHYKIIDELGLNVIILEKDFEILESEAKKYLGKNLDKKSLDTIQSFGEQFSSKIVSSYLNKMGIKSRPYNSWELGFVTDDRFGEAEPLEGTFVALNKSIDHLDQIPIITGFIGKTQRGEITTLGRGGSDYSAGIIGAAIGAEEIQIWTDVDGIMSADPKAVNNARTLETVSFAEASELAFFGAKVLHPKTIFPSVSKNIPVRVLNTFNPSSKGTLILKVGKQNGEVVKAITSKPNVILINVSSTRMLGAYGFLEQLFAIFGKYKQSVDVISTSEVSVSMTLNNEGNIDKIIKELQGIADVKITKGKSIICVIGEGMRKTVGVLGKVFTSVAESGINIEMVSQGSSGVNITFIVDERVRIKTINALHNVYYGEKDIGYGKN